MKIATPNIRKLAIATGLTLSASGVLMSAATVADTKPKNYPDGTWISIKGTVVEQNPNQFTLDYGEDTIIVEMDDFDSNHEGSLVFLGDEVTVYGRVDNDFYHKRTIEAASLYVDDLNLSITDASPADEEDPYYSYYFHTPILYGVEVRGEVTSVDGREFTIDYAGQKLKVDTSLMAYNPMDDQGFQQIDKGDYVVVSGEMDLDLFERQELLAENIVTVM